VNLEGRERVAAALLDLDTLHREVLVLRFHEELSLNEIATVTRTPLSTVKSRLYRGLAAIRPKLAAYGEANCAFGEAAAEGVEERLEVEIQARTADLSARPATVDALPERA